MECQLENTSVHYEMFGAGRPLVVLHGGAVVEDSGTAILYRFGGDLWNQGDAEYQTGEDSDLEASCERGFGHVEY